ncbi:hypothetical protein F5878DRAFT_669743 [Lentinula raphanica]|uniref:Uncharacterized protein n=1 Tax=Lentinula raphanica TaxID=153919 RepID=A0AA38NX96_9AGAR|nr:hypothetical protein F5878DRAFT_669743 [Lentinula raphanica]
MTRPGLMKTLVINISFRISSGTVQGLKFHEYNSDDFNTNVMHQEKYLQPKEPRDTPQSPGFPEILRDFQRFSKQPRQPGPRYIFPDVKTFLLFLNEAAKKPKSADAVDKSQLDNPSLISIPEPDPSSQPIPEPEPSTERAKRIANRNANKRSEPDHNEEEEDEEEYDEEDDEEEEDEEEEEEDEEGKEEDELILRLHPNTLKKVHPESILYLKDASVSIKERRIAIENLTARQSAYEFNCQNNILRNRWNMSQITGGRTGSDIIKNGFRTPTPSPSSCVSTEKPVPTS